jgi:hypothetical protein
MLASHSGRRRSLQARRVASPEPAARSDSLIVMSAQPVQEHDPNDPVEILRVLPERFREQFFNEYAVAAEAARRPEGYRALHDLLRVWRLTAAPTPSRVLRPVSLVCGRPCWPAASKAQCRSRRSSRTGPPA